MTLDQLESAKKIKSRVDGYYEQLNKLPNFREYSNDALRVNYNNNYLIVPASIKDTILLLIEAEYNKDIEKLKKEFKEL